MSDPTGQEREALEFYADRTNWFHRQPGMAGKPRAMQDAGQRARAALTAREEPPTHDEVVARAESLLREHWKSIGLDPDAMASLDGLAASERDTWLARARDEGTEQEPER